MRRERRSGRAADFLGWRRGAGACGQEEGGLGVVAEGVTEDAESPWRVAKGLGDGLGRMSFDIKSAEGLVLPLFGQGRFEEEAVRIC